MEPEQGLDLRCQDGVVAALGGEPGVALVTRQPADREEDLFCTSVQVRVHDSAFTPRHPI
jgi:hypothetical protein